MTATKITQTGYSQGFRQFFKVVDWHISESTGRIFFFVLQGTFWVLKMGATWGGGGTGGMLPTKNRTLRNAVSSISGTQESVFQARLEFTQILRNDQLQVLLL